MTKDIIQEEAQLAWEEAGCIGTVLMGTGLGKTRLGGNIVRKLHPASVLIVSSRVPLLKQWEEEMDGLSNITYMCINSAYKVSGTYELLIVDECHRSVSESFRQVYTNVIYNKLLCLTATLPTNNVEYLLDKAPLVYSKTLEDVRGHENVVSDYFVYNLVTGIDKATERKYFVFNNLFNEAMIKLSRYAKLKVYGDYNSIYDMAKQFSAGKRIPQNEEEKEIIKFSKQYWSSMSMRRRCIQDNTAKIKVAHDVLEYLGPERKWIVACPSIDYAKMLSVVLGGVTYHSRLPSKKREEILQRFKSGEERIIISVKALNEGLDVPEADSVLVVAGDSTELEAAQLLGRVVRARHGKRAIMINLTTVGTVEEKWTAKRSAQFKPKWVSEIISIARSQD